MTENKQEILDALLPALQKTRLLNDLIALEYVNEGTQETVVAYFPGKEKRINVTMDSGASMIFDVILRLK